MPGNPLIQAQLVPFRVFHPLSNPEIALGTRTSCSASSRWMTPSSASSIKSRAESTISCRTSSVPARSVLLRARSMLASACAS
ncbi:MAG: hypothetical protein MZV64_60150 [Ignavibacteriales bacterium]|nr:hypothetical protein [Ignavibacteriales bacterium]